MPHVKLKPGLRTVWKRTCWHSGHSAGSAGKGTPLGEGSGGGGGGGGASFCSAASFSSAEVYHHSSSCRNKVNTTRHAVGMCFHLA